MHSAFLKLTRNPLKFQIFLLQKLPSAFFCGLKLKSVDAAEAIVTVPYKWFSKNPFRSTYFACLSMAAEMSTGVLAMGHCWKKDPKLSMLVTHIEGVFLKKATHDTLFICKEGMALQAAILQAQKTGEAVPYKAKSVGYDKTGEVIAEFFITWSFKSKSNN